MSKHIPLPVDMCWKIYSLLSHDGKWGLFCALFPQKGYVPDSLVADVKTICNCCWRRRRTQDCYVCHIDYCEKCVSQHTNFIENPETYITNADSNEIFYATICKLCKTAFDQTGYFKKRLKRIKLEFY